jgi:transposase
VLNVETKAEIKRLFYAEHFTMNAIADHLGIHHDTVRSVLERERALAVAAPLRNSKLDAFVPFITETLKTYPKLTATRLAAMLKDRGYSGSVQILRRRVAQLRDRPSRKRAFVPLTAYAGEEAQVDWGHFGLLRVGRAERRLSCFVMVLAYSRAVYARFFLDQSLESFLAGHVAAFRHFGGVARRLRYDNLKTAVIERHGQAVRYNDSLLELAGHYRFGPSACNPYSGHEKGRVERTIRYIRDSFFAGRELRDLKSANAELLRWVTEVANQRPWPDDRGRTVASVFADEVPRLLTLPEHDHDVTHRREVRSGKVPYVRFDLNDYSIPFALAGRPLTLVATEDEVRIIDGANEVARHHRTFDRGQRVTEKEHFAGIYETRPGVETVAGREYIKRLIPETGALYDLMVEQGEPLGSSTAKIFELVESYGIETVRAGVKQAIERKLAKLSYVAQICRQTALFRKEPPRIAIDLPDRPNVRDLTVTPHALEDYDKLAHDEPKPTVPSTEDRS